VVEYLEKLPPDTILLTGTTTGVDQVVREEGERMGFEIWVYEPNFDYYDTPTEAYHARNRLIIEEADAVVSFWDGKSKGTAMAIRYAHQQGKPVEIYHSKPIS
jgi:nucleoside 2-deoxyribosyltransferase